LIGRDTVEPPTCAGDVAPPTEIAMGWFPEDRPDGTWILTWYKPTYGGARNPVPPYTNAGLPPIETVTGVVVRDSGVASAGLPLAGGLVTGPSPLQ
jgi:hypothetical protein